MKKVFVGKFNELDLKSGKDKEEIEKKKQETGLKYVISKLGKDNTLSVWVSDDFDL